MSIRQTVQQNPTAAVASRHGALEGVAPLLEARGIGKRFGDLVANEGISLCVQPGEIHALLGENGAGKSTFVQILYGALRPSEGELLWEGKTWRPAGPGAARAAGVAMIYQHFSLFETLTVAQNIALARPPGGRSMEARGVIAGLSAEYGLDLEPEAGVSDLSVGERQRIEIVRALMQRPKLLIMDEPTAVLTPQETGALFETLRKIAAEGCAILYISHRLDEVRRLCHRATILRRGRVVGEVDPAGESPASLARLMVADDVEPVHRLPRALVGGVPRLALKRLSAPAPGPFNVALHDVSLEVYAGEIVAVAGVAGNGQSELFELSSGERLAAVPEAICIDGTPSGRLGIQARRRLGAAFVPEERLGHAAVSGLPLPENVLLTRHGTDRGLVRRGFIRRAPVREASRRIRSRFDVRSATDESPAGTLSGGNLQKFVIGREIDRAPALLIVQQPTWGVDAGAAARVRQALVDLAGGGGSVLVISQDLDEIFEIAHRVAVISRGRLSAAVPVGSVAIDDIGILMSGGGA